MPNLNTVKFTLEAIYLCKNKVTSIDEDYFKGFKALKIISIGENELTEVWLG